MSRILDNYDMFCEHDAEQQAMLAKLPKCSECDEYIQSDYLYLINDEFICEECMEKYHRMPVEDYVC